MLWGVNLLGYALGPLRSHGKTSSDTLSLRFSRNGTKRPKDVR